MRLFLGLLWMSHLTHSLTWGLQLRTPRYRPSLAVQVRRYYPDTPPAGPQEPDSHENTHGGEVVQSSVVPVSSPAYPTAAAPSAAVPSGEPETTQGEDTATPSAGSSASAIPSDVVSSDTQVVLPTVATPSTVPPSILPTYTPSDISQTMSSYPVDTPPSGVDDCESLSGSSCGFSETYYPTMPIPTTTAGSDQPEIPADSTPDSKSIYPTALPSDNDSTPVPPTQESLTTTVGSTAQEQESVLEPGYPMDTPEYPSIPTATPNGDGNDTGSEGEPNDGVVSASYRAGEVETATPTVPGDSMSSMTPSSTTLVTSIDVGYHVTSAPTSTTCTTSTAGQQGASYTMLGWSDAPNATPFTYSAPPNVKYVTHYHTVDAPEGATPTMTPTDP
ncbi:hypothetical protein IWQ62_002257 [Dispira parvispora]|uniref:Uncharacterized protein n=1 Tax=Dispira parvispora TaxID=1520584 RepID=A0A9W8AQD6_9FUNG|nr:hypothetical protein IWQ62_002257 [Dispira parvispora]